MPISSSLSLNRPQPQPWSCIPTRARSVALPCQRRLRARRRHGPSVLPPRSESPASPRSCWWSHAGSSSAGVLPSSLCALSQVQRPAGRIHGLPRVQGSRSTPPWPARPLGRTVGGAVHLLQSVRIRRWSLLCLLSRQVTMCPSALDNFTHIVYLCYLV